MVVIVLGVFFGIVYPEGLVISPPTPFQALGGNLFVLIAHVAQLKGVGFCACGHVVTRSGVQCSEDL